MAALSREPGLSRNSAWIGLTKAAADQMALEIERVVDGGMSREEALSRMRFPFPTWR